MLKYEHPSGAALQVLQVEPTTRGRNSLKSQSPAIFYLKNSD